MTEKNIEEQQNETQEVKQIMAKDYGVDILLEDVSLEETKNSDFPTDAYNVKYKLEDKDKIDVCRGSRVKIFDYYYDKYGSGVLQTISWGSGKVNPRVWLSNKETAQRKKRKR